MPHVVIKVDDLEQFNINDCKKFRKQYNANVNYFMVKDDTLYVRTFERGVEDETKACGTGMVACFIRALDLKLISSNVNVYPKSKELINIKKQNDNLYFTGEVKNIISKEVK